MSSRNDGSTKPQLGKPWRPGWIISPTASGHSCTSSVARAVPRDVDVRGRNVVRVVRRRRQSLHAGVDRPDAVRAHVPERWCSRDVGCAVSHGSGWLLNLVVQDAESHSMLIRSPLVAKRLSPAEAA